MGGLPSPADDAYSYSLLARLLHSLPHVNVTFHKVPADFDPDDPVYLESLGILGSLPAAWLILMLLLLLIYLLTRCCDRKQRQARSISAMKAVLAVVAVLCCAAVGVGLYGNDDFHNGLERTIDEGKQVDVLISKIRNQTDDIERQLRVQADRQIRDLSNIFQAPNNNQTLFRQVDAAFKKVIDNRNLTVNYAKDIRQPLAGLDLSFAVALGERFEAARWPATMAVLSALLLLCVVLLVGVARHHRCALIAFSVGGLLAVIASHLMASVYLSAGVALGDLCTAPDRFVETRATSALSKDILKYYTSCERGRANPFMLRLREAKQAVDNMRTSLNAMSKPAEYLFPKKGVDTKITSLKNDINAAEKFIDSLTTLMDCHSLYLHYLRGARALCDAGLTGLTLMLLSALLAGFLLTVLVWVDSHTWIYIGKKKDYHQVNETDPYLPPPQASQAIAARTLQRSQGSSYPPDTPPPSYTAALMHNRSPMHATAPPHPHEADMLLDGCDMRPPEHQRGSAHMAHLRGHTLGRLPSHHQEPVLGGPNNGKYATLSKQCKTLESSDFY